MINSKGVEVMKRIISQAGNYVKENYGILFLCVIITGFFYSFFIDRMAVKLYPGYITDITIKAYFSETDSVENWIELRDYATDSALWEAIDDAEKSDGWQSQVINDSRRWTIADVRKPAYIRFSSSKRGSIGIACGGGKGIAEITCGNRTEEYALLENEGDTVLPIYKNPSASAYRKATLINILFFVFAYVIVWMGMSLIIYGGIALMKNYQFKEPISPERTVFIIAVIFVLWAFAGYIYGIEQYTTGFGDQGWYWNESWSVNPFMTAKMIAARFRGFMSAWIPVLCIRLGSLLSIPGEIFWITYLCLIHTAAFGIGLPYIYEYLTNKKAKSYQLIGIVLVYLPFWGCLLMAKLSDAGGLCFFILGISAYCKCKNEKKAVYAFISGACFAVSISYRMAYKHGLYSFILLAAVLFIIRLMKDKGSIEWKRILPVVGAFCLGILITSAPQIVSNAELGVISPFPYNPKGSDGTSFAGGSASGSLNGSLVFGYPYGAYDQSLKAISERFGAQSYDGAWSMDAILCMLSSQWMDTMVFMAKKLFFGMSIMKSIAYGSLITGYMQQRYPYSHNSDFAMIPMLNYLLIGACIFTLAACWKEITKKEKIFWAVMLFSLVLPQTLVHVEWRYFFIGYIFVYYMVFFVLLSSMEKLAADGNKEVITDKLNKLFLFEGFFVLACEVLLWTFY